MSSNKKTAALILFGVLAALFLTASCIVGGLNSGAVSLVTFYAGDSGAHIVDTTSVMQPSSEAAETTSVEITAYDGDRAETTAVEFTAYDGDRAETTSVEITAYHEESSESVSEETAVTERPYYSIVYMPSPDKAVLFAVILIFTVLFTLLYVLLFRRDQPLLGPDAALLLMLLSFTAVFYFLLPLDLTILKGRNIPAGKRMRLLLNDLLPLLLLFISFSAALFSLREIVCWLRAKGKSAWPLRERIFRIFSKDGEFPGRHVIPAVFLLTADAVILTVLIIFAAYGSRHGDSFPMLLVCGGAVLLFSCFSFSSVLSGLREMKKVRDSAVETAVRNERLRVDLIANVSHDLRTPLTSIIGYGSLLEKEPLSEEAKENLKLLNQKSGYMKDLVDSLFELTKVSSGVLTCEKTEIDVVKLLEQAAGLFEDDLKEAGLSLKRHYCRESLMITSDGSFLSRVVANLLQNAAKYALPGTRIHLSLTEEPGQIRIRLQNVSSYEMDFEASEIMERFVRGDKSRTGKGSGLGLAIAKTYTEALGGTFSVEIDGDVFTAVILLPEE